MHIYSIINLISGLISLFLVVYAWRFRKSPAFKEFSLLMVAVGFYAFGYAFELTATSLEQIRFWLYVEYIGVAYLPALLIIYALKFTNLEKWVNALTISVLFGLSTTTLIINYTNNLHHLFYASMTLLQKGTLTLLVITKGPWYWVHIIYVNASFVIFNIILYYFYKGVAKIYRRQVFIILAASLIMWIGLLLFLTHLAPEAIDINPIVFTLSGIVIAWGMMFYRIFDLVPIALENIYQSIHDGVIILDNDKRIVGCNPIAVKVLGDYAKNPVGKMLKELTEFSKLVRPLFESEKGEFNMALEGKESIRHYHTRTSIIYNRNGLMIGRAIIFTDITRIIENENLLRDNELKLRELNATKDKLFSIIAHDLKNPFQVLLGLSELIQDEAEMINNELIKKYSNQLIQSTVQTHKLLQNLLDWSVAQSGGINFNPVTIKLKQIVDEVTDTIRPSALAKKISVEINVPPEYQIFADNKMIQTVIRNLIANAVKFSFANKTISISALRTEGYIELTVEDSGVGMNPEKVNDLFRIDKMSSSPGTSGESGTGLGLILCKEFIEKNNGSISARSTEGKGSAFIIRLPEANLR